MSDEISVNFYNVEQCGFYHRGINDAMFGDLESVLEDIYDWINDDQPTLGNTKTFLTNDESTFLPVYCYAIERNQQTNDYLLVAWNETETAEGAFASVQANATVGTAQVTTTNPPRNSIPGHPTYFWFLTEENIFATIRFGGRLNGNPGMNMFVRGFLERFSQWAVVEDNEEERSLDTEILGYTDEDDGEPRNDVKPRFKTSLSRKRGEIEYIRQNRERIRKVIRKDEYSPTVDAQRTLLQSMFACLGVGDFQNQVIGSSRYKYELNFTPGEDDLEQIISNWQERHDDVWDDVGFDFENENQTRWLGSSIVKDVLEVNIRWNSSQSVANPSSLLRALSEQRENLLELITEN